jgi:DNA polymerase-1
MQGTAADIIKRAMLACDAWICNTGADVKMIMQVHDELVFEVADAELESAIERICGIMSSAADLKVPLLVDVGSGANWDEAH